jgi:hypothetical protein
VAFIDKEQLSIIEDALLYVLLLSWLIYFLHIAFVKGRVPWMEILSSQQDNKELKDDSGPWVKTVMTTATTDQECWRDNNATSPILTPEHSKITPDTPDQPPNVSASPFSNSLNSQVTCESTRDPPMTIMPMHQLQTERFQL